MAAPAYSVSDFTVAMQSLLPTGMAWPRDPDATQTQVMAGLAPTYVRQSARSAQLLADSFPATSYELLPQWEATLGLPDQCLGSVSTIQLRRSQVVSRLAGQGGQSAANFISYAAALGYVGCTVTNFAPFRAGQSTAGQPCGGPAWSHTWAINAPINTIRPFSAGVSAAGEPLCTWGNALLECKLSMIEPAHSILQFRYS